MSKSLEEVAAKVKDRVDESVRRDGATLPGIPVGPATIRVRKPVTVTDTVRRMSAALDSLPTDEDRSRVVGALASLYLPGVGVRRES